MPEAPVWFTDDVTLYPVTLIWRNARRLGFVAGPLIFAFFLFRKAIGWRFQASYGTMRPERLRLVSIDDVPASVRTQLAPSVESCRKVGFTPCFIWERAFIGGRRTFVVSLIDEEGTTHATAIWLHVSLRGQSRELAALSCHSVTRTAMTFDTGAIAVTDRHPELIPADHDLAMLPLETPPEDLISAHRERIAARRDLLSFDCASLEEQTLKAAQANFDWRLERGYLTPITPREVRLLSGS